MKLLHLVTLLALGLTLCLAQDSGNDAKCRPAFDACAKDLGHPITSSDFEAIHVCLITNPDIQFDCYEFSIKEVATLDKPEKDKECKEKLQACDDLNKAKEVSEAGCSSFFEAQNCYIELSAECTDVELPTVEAEIILEAYENQCNPERVAVSQECVGYFKECQEEFESKGEAQTCEDVGYLRYCAYETGTCVRSLQSYVEAADARLCGSDATDSCDAYMKECEAELPSPPTCTAATERKTCYEELAGPCFVHTPENVISEWLEACTDVPETDPAWTGMSEQCETDYEYKGNIWRSDNIYPELCSNALRLRQNLQRHSCPINLSEEVTNVLRTMCGSVKS